MDDEEQIEQIEEEQEESMIEQVESQADAREDAGFDDSYGSPEEHNVENAHTFLKRAVFETDDTTKVANLKQAEIGTPQLPIRVWHNIALSFKMRGNDSLQKYCLAKAGITSDTSLGRDGTALRLAVTQRKDIRRIRSKDKDSDKK